MLSSHNYRVYENDVLIYTGTFKLNSGERLIVSYPALGQTIRLEADQHPLHPGKSRPRAAIEGCGVSSVNVRDKMITFPPDDLDEEVAVTCNVIIDSYDPNDKQAMPTGTGLNNAVVQGQELEYIVRFQNTGTDTAYTVRVVDTLDLALDVSSFTEGVRSHPYALEVTGKGQAVLSFNFYNINLPYKSIDELGSNGMFSFRIKIPATTVLGAEIKNKAHIFFDYNSAIITNETMHTVDNTVLTDFSKGSLVQEGGITSTQAKFNQGAVRIYPNPTAGNITIELSEIGKSNELRIMSTLGVVQNTTSLSNVSLQEVNIGSLSAGIYIYQLWKDGAQVGTGMLQMK